MTQRFARLPEQNDVQDSSLNCKEVHCVLKFVCVTAICDRSVNDLK